MRSLEKLFSLLVKGIVILILSVMASLGAITFIHIIVDPKRAEILLPKNKTPQGIFEVEESIQFDSTTGDIIIIE